MHVEQWRDRHGKLRVYFRRGKTGKRIPLPDMGSPDFEAAYNAARAMRPTDQPATTPNTIGALIASYLKSPAFVELRRSSKSGYLSRLERIRQDHGFRTLSGMTRAGIETHILEPLAGKPGARLDTLKKLRILIRHAMRIDWLDRDPTIGIKRPKMQRIRSWTEAEIAAFEMRWPVGTKQRLAFAIFLYTGQRISDVSKMGWPDVSTATIRVVQQKTGKALAIPQHRVLRDILAGTPRENVTILVTAYGKAFSTKGLGQWLRDAITKAGLPLDCQPHGLRKAAGRRLAEAGCSTKEVQSILGHDTLSETENYTADADQERLAVAAITRLQGRKPNR